MSVDNTTIDYEQARDTFAPSCSSPPGPAAVGQGPMAQLNDGELTTAQVEEVFQALLQLVTCDDPNSPSTDKKSSALNRLANRMVKEGMNGAEDGDITGRELKFAVLCNVLAAFMRIQNPGILTNITQCIEQAICALVPTPVSSAAIFETLLHAFLHTIRVSKVSSVYHVRKPVSKAVVYIPATNPPLVSDLVALPDIVFRHCPLHELTHQMHTLEDLVMEDVAAGLLPVMVHAVVGTSPYSFSDDISRLRKLCMKYNITLSLDGPGLALLLTTDKIIEPLVAAIKDSNLRLSLTLPLHHILPDLPMTAWMTYVRLPDMSGLLEGSSPVPNPSTSVGLYVYLSGTTAKALKNNVNRRVEQARCLHNKVRSLPYAELLTEPSNIYAIKWRFSLSEATETRRQDMMYIHKKLCQKWESLGIPKGALAIHEKYFSYLLLVHHLPSTVTDKMLAMFEECDAVVNSVTKCRLPIQVTIANEEQLVLNPANPSNPFILASFRFVPMFYKVIEKLSDAQVTELNLINQKLSSILREKDPVFQSIMIDGQVWVSISADPIAFTPIFESTYLDNLMSMVREVMEAMEKDDEVMVNAQAEVTKKGIEEAEKMIKQLNEEDEASESVLRLIPIVGTLTEWWNPRKKPTLNPIHFDLRTTKLSMGADFMS